MVDSTADRRQLAVRTTQASGGVPAWAWADVALAPRARLYERRNAVPCHADGNRVQSRLGVGRCVPFIEGGRSKGIEVLSSSKTSS